MPIPKQIQIMKQKQMPIPKQIRKQAQKRKLALEALMNYMLLYLETGIIL